MNQKLVALPITSAPLYVHMFHVGDLFSPFQMATYWLLVKDTPNSERIACAVDIFVVERQSLLILDALTPALLTISRDNSEYHLHPQSRGS